MKSMRLLIGILALSTIVQASPVDDFVQSAMDIQKVPGVCWTVIDPKGSATTKSDGYANLETKSPFSPNTAHRIASLSKQFCAYAILNLQKEGKLSITDSLSKFFPEVTPTWDKITIAQTLAHRSGIADYTASFNYSRDYSVEEFIKLITTKPLAEEPGSTYRYNNFGYATLGLVVQKVSGMPLADYVKRVIFDPIGMKNSQYFRPDTLIENRSDGYKWVNNKFTNTQYYRDDVFDGSGGILSSMEDMVLYERALRQEKVLDKTILAFQRKPFIGLSGYGAGWNFNLIKDQQIVVHTGSSFGFTSCFLRNLTTGYTVILFRNADPEGKGAGSREWAEKILELSINGK
jgi:CubicO group peptidase (beta-lactamase class C family)